MIKTFQVLMMGVVVAAASLGRPVTVRAQSASQPGVDLPRFELAKAGGDRRWTGPGLALAIDRNATPHLAASVQVETDFHHKTAVLGGARVTTGFYYGSVRDPVPGRFFARALAGVVNGAFDGMHQAGQVAGGADVMLSRTRAVGLRWEVGYELTPGGVQGHTNGRVAIGLILGPRLAD